MTLYLNCGLSDSQRCRLTFARLRLNKYFYFLLISSKIDFLNFWFLWKSEMRIFLHLRENERNFQHLTLS